MDNHYEYISITIESKLVLVIQRKTNYIVKALKLQIKENNICSAFNMPYVDSTYA